MLEMAKYIENNENIKKRVIGTLYYPGIVLTFALFITFIILTFGVPRLESVYSGLKGTMPLPTKIFIAIGIFLSKIWFIFPILIILLITILKKILKEEKVQIYIDDFKLRNALFGNLFHRLAIAKFARTLSLLYGSGVSIIQAMEIVIKTTDNKIVQKTLLDLIKNLHEGEPIANYIRKSRLFTNIAINMIASGEESGTLELMLTKLADFYEYQVNTTLQSLTTLLEPIIMLFVGAVIAAVILILSLPFLELGAILK
ncbi:MAG: type II secretion system F family protein [Armatimonadetes bacterium]|nr:type II secretion system F family protein [Armatimonadota bacterium]